MTLNEYCLKMYSRNWIQLPEDERARAYKLHKALGNNKTFEDLLGGLFK